MTKAKKKKKNTFYLILNKYIIFIEEGGKKI